MLGIDVGTQSAKCVVLDVQGELGGVGQMGYPVQMPRPQWAEQDPETWWHAAVHAVKTAIRKAKIAGDRVRAIGVTGQMHGAVLIGDQMQALRPAIIWMDRRSANLCEIVQARLSLDVTQQVAGNRLSPGFAGASLAWLREVEPDVIEQTRAVIQPKDYLVMRLTGQLSSEPSDASATWLYDIGQQQWSETLAAACRVPMDKLPLLYASGEVVGTLHKEAARALKLREGIPVIAGAADQAALLLGAGVVESGRGSITVGTGGQMTIVTNRPRIDSGLRLNTFCHALPGRWYTMGAILNGGNTLRWWRDICGEPAYDKLLEQAAQVPAGSEGLIFLPYLEGERTPHMDPGATGAFIGLTARHTQAHLTRAVLEGVAYAFRDCLLVLQTLGPTPDHFLVGGGGAQGPLWRHILANVLGVSVQTILGAEHTALGAAMLAGVGTGLFYDIAQAVARAVKYGPIEPPDPEIQAVYQEQFVRFQALYRAIRPI